MIGRRLRRAITNVRKGRVFDSISVSVPVSVVESATHVRSFTPNNGPFVTYLSVISKNRRLWPKTSEYFSETKDICRARGCSTSVGRGSASAIGIMIPSSEGGTALELADVASFFFSRAGTVVCWGFPGLVSSVFASRFFWLSRFTRFPRPRLPTSESGECDRVFDFELLVSACVASLVACEVVVGGLVDMMEIEQA